MVPQGKRKLEQFLAVLMDEQGGAGLSPRMIRWSPTHAPNGPNSIDGSPPLTPSSSAGRKRMRTLVDWRRSGRRPDNRLGVDRGDRQGRDFRARSRLGGVVGSGPTSVHHRRQTEASWHQQARQPISSQAADPRRASGVAPCRRARHPARPMGQSATRARPSQCRHCGVRQQARQDRLGGATARRKVRGRGTTLGGVVVGRGRAEAR